MNSRRMNQPTKCMAFLLSVCFAAAVFIFNNSTLIVITFVANHAINCMQHKQCDF